MELKAMWATNGSSNQCFWCKCISKGRQRTASPFCFWDILAMAKGALFLEPRIWRQATEPEVKKQFLRLLAGKKGGGK